MRFYNLIFFLLIVKISGCTSPKESAPILPNIVLIFTDDQGYNDVGVFGSPDIDTPNLDQMASEGIKFTNFYVAQAVCSASRAALLTGTYSNRLGIHGALDHSSTHGLNPDETTIAEMLKPLGYQTAIFGKWHLGHHPDFLPTNQGFDEYFGIPYSNDMWPNHPETKDYYPPLPLYQNDQVADTVWTDQSMFTTWFTEKSVDFIKRNTENPFFLYLAHPMPHVPLFVSDKFKGKSERGLYGDVIMEIDWSVGEVLKALKENGLEENTLVIFLSDNGPWLSYSGHSGSAYPLREGKGTSWDGGVKVPTIMKWKGKIPEGKVQKNPAMTIDILPTIASFTGAQLPALPIDGLDISSMLVDYTAASPQEAYFVYYNRNELQAVVMGEWKLYFPHKYRTIAPDQNFRDDGIPIKYTMVDLAEMELYHIPTDPSEKNNVIGENPQVVDMFVKLADKAREDLGDALNGNDGNNLRQPGRIN
ncbi:arylsulfatase [Aquiflexum balticum DSM 16537]|uniref:Arylsulfatase n=1 Tax=Aquiflexum balticum DSM 16537 TaxID=758820 RepID=A0A1W2H9U3_9BACT|nr:sulfatase [Aquiflexum balticum]SMD45647.1 arylsulfatase [Aquiflexum balticum DSM 16537]